VNTNIDMVLPDLEMPELDGYSTRKKIREINDEIPIIAFTAAFLDEEMQNILLATGFTDSISKPFKPDEFILKFSKHLK
jgi:CheY-like chemotaxis protein